MEEKLRGILLNSVNYQDNDKILNIFTLEKGVVSAKIKGVKKAGAKLKFATEPFCFSEYILTSRGEYNSVINASLIDSFYPIREDIYKYFSAGTIVEFVKRFYKENIVSENTFFEVVTALKDIAYSSIKPEIVVLRFLIDALSYAGFMLNLDKCFLCGCDVDGRVFFDYRSGAFFCEDCFDGLGREINLVTFKTLQDVKNGVNEVEREHAIKGLKLLNYYIENRLDEQMKCLKELINL